MQEWYNVVDSQDKKFVQAIAEAMSINILSPIPVVETAMQNAVSLTFTHKSPNSLVPINSIDEWDGWLNGIWEKHPNGITTNRNGYIEFPEMREWSHWMYCHAHSIVKYDISGGNYARYSSYFVLADPKCGGGTSMQFIAHADGAEIYRSKELYLADNGIYIEFSIPLNTRIFTIEIDDLGSNGCDHYVLGEPQLFSKEQVPLANFADADINKDGQVDLSDVKIVRIAMQNSTSHHTDVNGDGVTDELDLLIVKGKAHEAIAAAAPSLIRRKRLTTWGELKSIGF